MQEQHIIFVPGKNPKPPEQAHRRLLWQVLHEGIHRQSPQALQRLDAIAGNFHVCAWNHLFYHSHKEETHEQPWIDVLLDREGPSENDIAQAGHLHIKLSRLLYNIADVAPFLVQLIGSKAIKATVKETERYFHNHDNIACEIREVLKQQLRPLLRDNANILLIGHSLGSVIAYDTLWELGHEELIPGTVNTFLTLGSPMGMRFVQHHLLGNKQEGEKRYPYHINNWVNVASVGDLTAVDPCLHDDFGEMIELGLIDTIEDHCDGVYNFYHNEEGLNCHRSYGYLFNPVVDGIISKWLLTYP